ncbi:MAG TPA: M48 family metalloprotease [Steroidobacteraceae bacterium]|nr:M48 family metalloprotease [Steroidobacteraceae bacterium]
MKIGAGTVRFIASALPGFMTIQAHAQTLVPIPAPTDAALVFAGDQFRFWLALQAVTLALPLLALLLVKRTSIDARLAAWSGRRWPLHCGLLGVLFVLLYLVVSMPLGFWQSVRIRRLLDMAAPSFPDWGVARIGDLLPWLLLAALASWLPLWIVRRNPRWGWLGAAGVLSCAALGYLLWSGTPSASLNERYQALSDPDWQSRFATLERKAGVRDIPLFIEQTRAGQSCRMSNLAIGLGPTGAIVLKDHIFEAWTPEMVEAAYAHELKHVLLDNNWRAALLVVLLVVFGAATVNVFAVRGVRILGNRLGLTAGEPAVCLLMLLGFHVYMLVAQPVFNTVGRRFEFEADRFSLELTHHNLARAQIPSQPCAPLSLPEETRFRQLYINNHPDMATRIRFASSYRPWETGEPLVYAKYMNSKGAQ